VSASVNARARASARPLRFVFCRNGIMVAQVTQLAPEPLAVEECAAQDDHALAVDGHLLQQKPDRSSNRLRSFPLP
jgi:hypothetical protein